ncbi:MAG TPA: hypothetical protein VFE06_09055 [Acidobacteriaceae bacterium]|jgi:hypothetical protein|nr:hypothetical protein [Acidobacteriaceae bacterium]
MHFVVSQASIGQANRALACRMLACNRADAGIRFSYVATVSVREHRQVRRHENN